MLLATDPSDDDTSTDDSGGVNTKEIRAMERGQRKKNNKRRRRNRKGDNNLPQKKEQTLYDLMSKSPVSSSAVQSPARGVAVGEQQDNNRQEANIDLEAGITNGSSTANNVGGSASNGSIRDSGTRNGKNSLSYFVCSVLWLVWLQVLHIYVKSLKNENFINFVHNVSKKIEEFG